MKSSLLLSVDFDQICSFSRVQWKHSSPLRRLWFQRTAYGLYGESDELKLLLNFGDSIDNIVLFTSSLVKSLNAVDTDWWNHKSPFRRLCEKRECQFGNCDDLIGIGYKICLHRCLKGQLRQAFPLRRGCCWGGSRHRVRIEVLQCRWVKFF